jgi:hypothetical protein
VAPLQLAIGAVLLWFDGGVVETFDDGYNRSFRTPAAWVGVRVSQGRHDQVRFDVGRADPRDQPIYGAIELGWTDIRFELAATDEPSVRGFFAQVAQDVGRRGPA